MYLLQEHRLQEAMKHELLSKIPLEKLAVIDAGKNAAEIVWEEKDREFYLDGLLYDVVAIKKVDGRTLIYCLNDTKEEQLLEQGASAISEAFSPGKKQKLPGTFKFHLPDFISVPFLSVPLHVASSCPVLPYSPKLCNIFMKINGPPPDLTFKPNTVL